MLLLPSGYICATVPPERLDELEIPLMIEHNTEKHKTAYTHTVDYKPGQLRRRKAITQSNKEASPTGVTTGISGHDRALTARKLADRSCRPSDFNRPGHMVPLRARSGGVLERRGHTEAATGEGCACLPSDVQTKWTSYRPRALIWTGGTSCRRDLRTSQAGRPSRLDGKKRRLLCFC